MAESISPEERLFKVIQQGKQTTEQGKRKQPKRSGGWFEALKGVAIPQAAGHPGAGGGGASWPSLRWPELDPANINKVLAVVLAVIFVFAIYAATSKHKNIAVIADAVAKIKVPTEEGEKKMVSLKGLSYYLGGMQKRDIFRPGLEAALPENASQKSELPAKVIEELKLQGISWGGVPKAMILVRNEKDSKMYFLVEGQAIGTTGFKILRITKNKVTVSNGYEETVLL